MRGYYLPRALFYNEGCLIRKHWSKNCLMPLKQLYLEKGPSFASTAEKFFDQTSQNILPGVDNPCSVREGTPPNMDKLPAPPQPITSSPSSPPNTIGVYTHAAPPLCKQVWRAASHQLSADHDGVKISFKRSSALYINASVPSFR